MIVLGTLEGSNKVVHPSVLTLSATHYRHTPTRSTSPTLEKKLARFLQAHPLEFSLVPRLSSPSQASCSISPPFNKTGHAPSTLASSITCDSVFTRFIPITDSHPVQSLNYPFDDELN